MNLKAVIIDDDKISRASVKKHLDKIYGVELIA